MMPGFGGPQALRCGRARRRLAVHRHLGHAERGGRGQALRAGALDFLSRTGRAGRAGNRACAARGPAIAVRGSPPSASCGSSRRAIDRVRAAPEALLTYDVMRDRIVEATHAPRHCSDAGLEELRTLSFAAQLDIRGGRRHAKRSRGSTDSAATGSGRAARHGELIPSSSGSRACRAIAPLPARRGSSISASACAPRRSAGAPPTSSCRTGASRRRTGSRASSSRTCRTSCARRSTRSSASPSCCTTAQVDPDSPQHTEFLGDILTSGRHLLQLINDVLDLAKVEAGKIEFRPEPVDLAQLVGEVVAILRTTAAKKQIQRRDRDRSDARQASCSTRRGSSRCSTTTCRTRSSSRPTAAASRSASCPRARERFRLEVEDTGIGIAPEDLGRLFVEFQQLDAGAAKRYQGTGPRPRADQAARRGAGRRGRRAQRRRARAASFHAVLAARRCRRATRSGDAARRAELAATRRAHGAGRRGRGRRTVMLVDALAKAGYAVEVAATGAEAIARCRERSFDAITLDLLLPDISGLDVLAALRAEGRARADAGDRGHGGAERGSSPASRCTTSCASRSTEHAASRARARRRTSRPPRWHPRRRRRPGALRLMDATLAQLGFSTITRSSGRCSARGCGELHPAAVVLDLVMRWHRRRRVPRSIPRCRSTRARPCWCGP